ncbi:MAG: twin-arginine translocase TatA/TatE family subunit [Bacteroidota bacterium]
MEINTIFIFLGSLGGSEIFLVLLAVLLLFGAKKIPELARGLGKGIREFKDASKDVQSEFSASMNEVTTAKQEIK